MTAQAFAYLVFGFVLVVLFAVIIIHYYAKKRHGKVEEAKYRMLDDDE
jgi:cbb3-type cytochrome oxidase subunit 3